MGELQKTSHDGPHEGHDHVHDASLARVAERAAGVRRVLWGVLGLNVLVAAAKVAWGLLSGSNAMFADGLHSFFDGTSNIIALVGIRMANQPPDESHPYGHTKFETYSAVAIGAMLLFAAYEVVTRAIEQLSGAGGATEVTGASFAIMVGTLGVNLFVTNFERRAGKRLGSEVLVADADHTSSDILVSAGVIVSLLLVGLGFDQADGIVSLLIAGAIVFTAFGILRRAGQTLSDAARLPVGTVEECAMADARVVGCHHVRTRGTESAVLVDLHVVVSAQMTVGEGHDVAHAVEERIRERFPEVTDVVVHIEPEGAAA